MAIWALLPLLAGPAWAQPVASAPVQSAFSPAAAYQSGHRGIDLKARPGTSVRAVTDATVALARPVAGKPVLVLVVDHPDLGRLRVTYEPVLPDVEAGDRVIAGQSIGTLATAGGHCGREPHCLHLGIKQDGRYLDPEFFLNHGQVVLKPLR
jgi:murein DD-endopeptidase MepM/ murein hydrolase activator NlpD